MESLGAYTFAGAFCFFGELLGDSTGVLLAYAAIAADLLPFRATRGSGASRALCPHRYSGCEPLAVRNQELVATCGVSPPPTWNAPSMEAPVHTPSPGASCLEKYPAFFFPDFLFLNFVWTKCARSFCWSARMEKSRPRSTGLPRFHGGTSDGRGNRHQKSEPFLECYVPRRRPRPAPYC
jgi:hypothetical protein